MELDPMIRCKVFPGQFSNEYAIEGVQADGDHFSLFAPVTAVEPDESPTRDRQVDGWLRVILWEKTRDLVIVQLSRESFESGRFVTVRLTEFKESPRPVTPER